MEMLSAGIADVRGDTSSLSSAALLASSAILRQKSIILVERHLFLLAQGCLAQQELFQLQRKAVFFHAVRLFSIFS